MNFDFMEHYRHHNILNNVIEQVARETQPVEGVSAYVCKNYQTLFRGVTLDRVLYDTDEVALEVQWGKRGKTYELVIPIRALEIRMEEAFRCQRLTDYLQAPASLEDEATRVACLTGWMGLQAWSKSLKCPKAAIDDEGGIFVWEDDNVYSELEFIGGQVEYFTKVIDAEDSLRAVDFPDIEAFLESPEAQNLLKAHSIGLVDPLERHFERHFKARPELDAPCPHPARNGHHEIYISRSARSQCCRACGAVGAPGDYGNLPL